MTGSRVRWLALFDAVATLLTLAAAIAVLWTIATRDRSRRISREEPPLPSAAIPLNGAEIRGSSGALVGVVEFSEFQCPFCGRFAKDSLPTLMSSYVDTGRVLFAFRHFPLDTRHPFSRKASAAAVCAGQQARFWDMHDLLFEQPAELSDAQLAARAAGLKLNLAMFRHCLETDGPAAVAADVALGSQLHVRGTPTFFVGVLDRAGMLSVTHRLSGAKPVADFKQVIDAILTSTLREVSSR